MNSNKLLVIIAGLQILTVAGQWLGQPSVLPTVQAQVPDAGAQRNQIIDELKGTNAKLDRLVTLLESGNVHVKTTAVEEKETRRTR
jgi:hypothetical protein